MVLAEALDLKSSEAALCRGARFSGLGQSAGANWLEVVCSHGVWVA